jgi:NDP-sugar pyrophosphorylase family protein
MPIGDMPILEILLRQMKRAQVDEVVLTVGHLAHLMQAFFQDGERLGLKISYSYEEHPLGTAGPLSLVAGLEDTFLVANGDVLTTLDLCSLVDFHRSSGAIATIASHARKVKIDLGVIQYNGSNEVIGYIEKPTYDFFVSMGIYFEPRVLPTFHTTSTWTSRFNPAFDRGRREGGRLSLRRLLARILGGGTIMNRPCRSLR